MAEAKKHKLDIFKVLDNISRKDKNYYSSLSEEEQKALQPYLVMRWLSGIKDARQVYFLNELVNPFVFDPALSKHKDLLVKLLTICTDGKSKRYYWNKTKSKKTSSTPQLVKVVKEIFGYNTIHAKEALPLLSDIDILQYAMSLGRQKDVISLIKKELKTRERTEIPL